MFKTLLSETRAFKIWSVHENFEDSKKCLSSDSELQIPPALVLIPSRQKSTTQELQQDVSPGASKPRDSLSYEFAWFANVSKVACWLQLPLLNNWFIAGPLSKQCKVLFSVIYFLCRRKKLLTEYGHSQSINWGYKGRNLCLRTRLPYAYCSF